MPWQPLRCGCHESAHLPPCCYPIPFADPDGDDRLSIEEFGFGGTTQEMHQHLVLQRRIGGSMNVGFYEAADLGQACRAAANPPGLPEPDPGYEWVCYRVVEPSAEQMRAFMGVEFSPAE